MKTKRGFFAFAAAVVLLLGPGLASAADGAAGVYKGSYVSYAAGGDYGSVTIIINDQGGVTCDFYSTPNGYGMITTQGVVTSTAPFLEASCENGISNGGQWYAISDSSSVAGVSISGTWTSHLGVVVGDPGPTGTFEAAHFSALDAIDPVAMTGAWTGGAGAFNVLAAGAGLVVTFEGWTNAASTTADGQLLGPVVGSPVWLLSDVGPKSIVRGTPVTLNMYAPASPSQADPVPSTVEPAGTMEITFLDCHNAIANLNTTTLTGPMNLQMLAGVAGAPGC